MDPKLAKGISRSIQRHLAAVAIPLSSTVRGVMFDALNWALQARDGRRKHRDPKPLNLGVTLAANRLSQNSAVLWVQRWLLRRPDSPLAAFGAAFVWQEEISRLDAGGRFFTERAWLVTVDVLTANHEQVSWLRWTAPTVVSSHLIDRFVERSGRPAAQDLRSVLADAVIWASLYHAQARRAGAGDFLPIVAPAPGGVICGGLDAVLSVHAQRQSSVLYAAEKIEVKKWGAKSNIFIASCLQTYIDDALLTPEQRAVVSDMRVWFEREGRSLIMTSVPAAFACYCKGGGSQGDQGDGEYLPVDWPDDVRRRLAEAFNPFLARVQQHFTHWERRTLERGILRHDFDALARQHRREPDQIIPVPPALEGAVVQTLHAPAPAD